jgi:hypothetical protein
MIRSRNKHVCTPGARRTKSAPWKRKLNRARVVKVETLPLNYVPEKLKPMRDVETKSSVPRKTITCGNNPVGPHYYTPKTITHRKIDYTATTAEDKEKQPPLAVHRVRNLQQLPEIEIVPYVSYGAVTYKN